MSINAEEDMEKRAMEIKEKIIEKFSSAPEGELFSRLTLFDTGIHLIQICDNKDPRLLAHLRIINEMLTEIVATNLQPNMDKIRELITTGFKMVKT